ncbi:hypothetical protein HY636_00210 [Candidatus Woesearchaeota archaeon]|nr:hypothetical protein [Candidatus Woesearchaeota archaeon]
MVLNLFDVVNQIQVREHYLNLVRSATIKTIKKANAKTLTKRSHETTNKEDDLVKTKGQIKKGSVKESNAKNEGIIKIIDDFDNVDKEGIDTTLGELGQKTESYSALVHSMQYQQLLDQYRRFLEAYLKEANSAAMPRYQYELGEDNGRREFKWGEEVATYHEIKDTIRKVKMNLLLGGWHNPVSWQAVQDYKFWKYVSKFNKVMAEVIEAGVGSGG